MSDLLTHIGRLEMVDVDLNLEPQCESEFHDGGGSPGFPQSHGGPATHYQITACGHGNGLRCLPHVKAIFASGGGYCDVCIKTNAAPSYRFIEL